MEVCALGALFVFVCFFFFLFKRAHIYAAGERLKYINIQAKSKKKKQKRVCL